ncbi:MAG: DUF4476 domain-containing protein [Ginsengibacter sp.]
MKLNRFIVTMFLLVGTLFSQGQQVHFVYLQTENNQPFYIKLDNKVTSSSSAGYLILPKLTEGDYNISVGFPKKEFPEESFKISVDKESHGFLLKNFGGKGWGLFNLQSFAIVMGNSPNEVPAIAKDFQTDPFSKMLADVVKDSSILEIKVAEATSLSSKIAKDSATKIVDTVAMNNNSEATASITYVETKNNNIGKSIDTALAFSDTIKSVDQSAVEPLLSNITRTLKKKNSDGTEMIYLDKNETSDDTIRIFIPAESFITQISKEDSQIVKSGSNLDTLQSVDIKSNEVDVAIAAKDIDSSKIIEENLTQQKSKPIPIDSIVSERNIVEDTVSNVLKSSQEGTMVEDEKQKITENEIPKVVKSTSTNSDCRAFASNEDFIKLRKKMAAENTNDDMIKVAKKYFRSQCFSTEQIKNLSFLFLTDESKYQFFDVAYAFTSDSSQYRVLESQLKDQYYINRFKAMIHQ